MKCHIIEYKMYAVTLKIVQTCVFYIYIYMQDVIFYVIYQLKRKKEKINLVGIVNGMTFQCCSIHI